MYLFNLCFQVSILLSSAALKCFDAFVQATNENLPPTVIRELAKELKNLDETPPEGIKVGINDDNFSTIYADIEGPAGTPYENGVFRMKLVLSHDFPHSPPKGYFLTKIFHPNVATNGEICVNTLKKDWNPSLGLRHVLLVVRCLLIEPFPESALNEQAGKMLLEDYEEYARHARLYTGIHALKPKAKPKTAISESTTALNVDQTNTVVGPAAAAAAAPLPPLSSCMGNNNNNKSSGQENASSTTADAIPPLNTLQKKEGSSVVIGVGNKVQVDKKKMDARKKSLKRL
ncbi:ubiquitin-conjugating enzyme E2 22 isoform X1 [Amborella trichopoda]|nr:ubiquitin-conjugating enzyme E2 22 isoform X1 [Amborella trichopoda]XP_020518001.1 ubiquitin-conjugating enzyme E2 22 isoform X1 [Amborella trichopoda]|eukprot:XP_011620406.1 ubiquitin-conjugating enzyme E2 22 isoform X1 [Amborella trichopoda]